MTQINLYSVFPMFYIPIFIYKYIYSIWKIYIELAFYFLFSYRFSPLFLSRVRIPWISENVVWQDLQSIQYSALGLGGWI